MSAWVLCPCGRNKLVEFEPEEGETYYCNARCAKRYKAAEPNLGPRLGFGTDSTTARSRRDGRLLDKIVGGKIVPGSGAVRGLDGDRIMPSGTMVEEKVTGSASYKLTLLDWEKLLGEAGRAGRHSVLLLNLRGHRIAMLPLDELLSRLGEDGL